MDYVWNIKSYLYLCGGKRKDKQYGHVCNDRWRVDEADR